MPDGTQVCVGTVCQTVGDAARSAAASPTTLTFTELDPGTYDVTVTNAAPYQDTASTIEITAGETTERDIVLQLAAVTVVPTEPGAATPISTGTAPPTQSPGNGVTPTQASSGGGAPSQPGGSSAPSAPGGGSKVRALPNTGTGSQSSTTGLELLALAVLSVVAAGLVGWRRRRL